MKRIIACSDGTWNKPNKMKNGKVIKTNVQKLFDCIENKDMYGKTIQIKYYNEGIGSRGGCIARLFNGVTGKGIDENIQKVYKFICWNYEPEDEIYLFGFSRGAYTARSVAGLIRKSGIIKVNDLDLYSLAYDLYRDRVNDPDSQKAVDFRNANSHEVASIKFIGVWDTVGSLGIPLNIFQWYNKRKYTFHDTTLSSIVENAYHAVAVDEKRINFIPTIWEKSKNPVHRNFHQVLEQRWFIGVHSNVGGGYADSILSDIALRWMFEKAKFAGLRFDPRIGNNIKGDCEGMLYDSYKGFYSIFGKMEREIIIDNIESFIDDTVFERIKRKGINYSPNNVMLHKVIKTGEPD